MQTTRKVTPEEKQAYFDLALSDAVERGQNPLHSQMMPHYILTTIFAITDQWPDVDPATVQTAKDQYARYMDWLKS